MLGHAIKSRLAPMLRFVAEQGQRLRVNIGPHHFYSEIPDFAELRRQRYRREPMSMVGVRGTDTAAQLRFVRECCLDYPAQPSCRGVYADAVARNGEPGYGPVEAMMLYCFVRTRRPAKIVQVGCGV